MEVTTPVLWTRGGPYQIQEGWKQYLSFKFYHPSSVIRHAVQDWFSLRFQKREYKFQELKKL